MYMPIGNGSSRHGITPVVSIVLLLMMTVALAGAAYSWFNQIQTDIQTDAERQLSTDLEARDVQCVDSPDEDYILAAVKNTGDRDLVGRSVDMYVYDNNGNLHAAPTGMDFTNSGGTVSAGSWQWMDGITNPSPPGSGAGFLAAGGFGQVQVNITSGLTAGSFYTAEISFTQSDASVNLGGCVAD